MNLHFWLSGAKDPLIIQISPASTLSWEDIVLFRGLMRKQVTIDMWVEWKRKFIQFKLETF